MGIRDFLSGGRHRDGSSPEKGIVVKSGPEEYQWVAHHRPGFSVHLQELRIVDGAPYDVLTLCDDKGKEQIVYFDISKFYGKEPSDAEIRAMKRNIEKVIKRTKRNLEEEQK